MPTAPTESMKTALEAVGTAAATAQENVRVAATETLETNIRTLGLLATEIRTEAIQHQVTVTAAINKATNALVTPMTDAQNASGLGFVNVEGAAVWQRDLEDPGKALVSAKAALMRADEAAKVVAKWADDMGVHYVDALEEISKVSDFLIMTTNVLPTEIALVEQLEELPAGRARDVLLDVRDWLSKRLVENRNRLDEFMAAWQTLIQKTQGNDPPSYVGVKDGLVTLNHTIATAGRVGHGVFMQLSASEES